MSHKLCAELKVTEALVTHLQGFRLSADPELARAATEREIELRKELTKLQEAVGKQSELELRTSKQRAA